MPRPGHDGGDMADCLRSHERTGQLMAAVACRYPCCYVSGNHELRTGEADRLKEWFRSFGVVVLQGQAMLLSVRGQRLCVGGLDDRRIGEKEWDRQLESCRGGEKCRLLFPAAFPPARFDPSVSVIGI